MRDSCLPEHLEMMRESRLRHLGLDRAARPFLHVPQEPDHLEPHGVAERVEYLRKVQLLDPWVMECSHPGKEFDRKRSIEASIATRSPSDQRPCQTADPWRSSVSSGCSTAPAPSARSSSSSRGPTTGSSARPSTAPPHAPSSAPAPPSATTPRR